MYIHAMYIYSILIYINKLTDTHYNNSIDFVYTCTGSVYSVHVHVPVYFTCTLYCMYMYILHVIYTCMTVQCANVHEHIQQYSTHSSPLQSVLADSLGATDLHNYTGRVLDLVSTAVHSGRDTEQCCDYPYQMLDKHCASRSQVGSCIHTCTCTCMCIIIMHTCTCTLYVHNNNAYMYMYIYVRT